MLPSFYLSNDKAREWNVARAALYGAGLGLLAGSFKTFGPLHHGAGSFLDVAVAAIGFAVLCAAAAAIRNAVARRLIWPNL